jgi:hypothetical protein
MGRKKITLDDLSGWAKEQVERKLRLQTPVSNVEAPGGLSPAEGRKTAIRLNARIPNKTELEYNRRYLGGRGKFEALTLRLPGGSGYKPDWMSIGESGRITLHEVKGSHRFHSQGRAATAFRECVVAFPEFDFIWAVRQSDGSWSLQHARRQS